MARIEPLTPPVCEAMARSRNLKDVEQLREMGKGVSYLDRGIDMDNHHLDEGPRSALSAL